MQNSFKQINEIIDNLLVISAEHPELPQIEQDILLEKLRKVYIQIQSAKKVEEGDNTPVQEPQVIVETKEIKGEKEVKEVKEKKEESQQPEYEKQPGITDDIDLFFDTEHESYTPETQPSQTAPKPEKLIEPEPLVSEDEDDLLQFIPQKPEPKPEIKPKTEPAPKAEPLSKPEPKQPATHAESATPRSLNDLFNKQQEDRSLGSQFQHAKVGDLTKAISINDKFTFIKELFNNKGEEFSAAILKLNQCASMDEAFDCLESLKKQYYWDTTATAYLSLCDLLRRKYL